MTTSPIERAAMSFAAELTRHRTERGLTKKQLAERMGFDPSYVSHVEGRRHRPTEDFARRAEAVLGAAGAIWRRFREYDDLRRARLMARHGGALVPAQWMAPGAGLVVEREVATLAYRDGFYHCRVRRALYNAGTEPVTRHLIRVAVDRYPGDPGRSNQHHRQHPLTFGELELRAYRGDQGDPEPMAWRARHDRDAFKEVWLLFENAAGRFPLYPGERATIEYAYRVGDDKWGPWFQRAVRLPTRRLAVCLDLPADLDPHVWGVQTSLSAEERPLRTPLTRRDEDGRVRFEWSTDEPALNVRYRLEWRFRRPASGGDAPTPGRAGDPIRAIGVVPREELLRRPACRLDLPRDEPVAREAVARLRDALSRLDERRPFSGGVGLAAPQLGLDRAVALVRPPDRAAEAVVLLNPRVVDETPDRDERYEGCLSFIDQRGLVPRPLRIDVEHSRWDGRRMITTFGYAMARLVAHQIDHLEGRLYVDRMAPGVPLVPVEEYRGTDDPWRY